MQLKLAAVLLFVVSSALAQDSRARLLGSLQDPSGAAVPGADVRATNTATGVAVSARSNETGNYEINYLLPGIYDITAELQGFKKYARQGVELRVADRLTLDITLEVGELAETVTVTGQPPLIDTASATIGQVFDHKRMTELPLSGGNPFVLSRLAPGVVNFAQPNHPSLGPAVEVVSNISVAGTRDHNTEYSIDGTPSMWGRNAGYVPPQEIVEEFKVETSSYDASLGHSPGGLVNVALRSGTNKLHGTLHHFHNNNKLQGMDYFQRRFLYDPSTGPVTEAKRKEVAPQHVINRYAFTFGGPVLIPRLYNGRNKTFWIYSYEGFIRPSAERGNSFYTVPATAQRQGDFSALLALGPSYQIYDPSTIAAAPNGRFSRQPFPGNVIPRSRHDQTALGMMEYFPQPNAAGSADGRNNFFRPTRSLNEYYSFTTRADHNFSERYRVFGRYSQMHQLFVSGQYFPNASSGNDRHRFSRGGGLDQVFMFSPNLLLNVRYGFTRFVQTFSPFGEGFDLAAAGFSPTLLSIIDPLAVTFPQIAVDQYQQLGATFPSGAYTNNHNLASDFTYTRGSHSLRFGGEFRLYREHNYNFATETPRIEFNPTWTRGPLDNSPVAPIGQGAASFLLGIPSGGQISKNASFAEQSWFSGFYLQDDWKITRRLTLNMGVRYEYESPISERFDRSVSGFDFSTSNPIEAQARANYALNPIPQIPVDQFRATGGILFAGAGGQRGLWAGDKNNIAPRIGLIFAWTPQTVIRAGYGIFYVPLSVDRLNVNQTGFSSRTNVVPSNNNGLSFLASLSNPFPGGALQPLGAAGGLSTDVGLGISYFNPQPLAGYVQRFSYSVQRELPKSILLDVSYVGSRSTKLGVTRQVNPVPREYLSTSPVRDQPVIDLLSAQVRNPFFPLLPGTSLAGQTVARSQLLRPRPHFIGISSTDTSGYAWYHSLQARFERRFAQGFTIQSSYTWSKFMEATAYLNEADDVPAKVISDQDRPHRVVFSGIYEVPFGRGRRFGSSASGVLGHLIGGWQIQGIYQAQSGAPLNFGNILFNGDLHDIVLPRSERTTDRWFNADAGFERNPQRQPASNIRTLSARFTGARMHGHNIWDISALKNFTLTETFKLQFRSEWLNALNHSHLAAPNTTPTSTLFGQVTATNNVPRQIYLALKLMF